MTTYQITSRAGQQMGTYDGDSPAEALLAMHRDAGYGEEIVWLDVQIPPRGLVFVDDGRALAGGATYREMLGDVDDWIIEEVEPCAYCGATVPADEPVPAVEDDTAWHRLAEAHAPGCEWVETRAHRREVAGA